MAGVESSASWTALLQSVLRYLGIRGVKRVTQEPVRAVTQDGIAFIGDSQAGYYVRTSGNVRGLRAGEQAPVLWSRGLGKAVVPAAILQHQTNRGSAPSLPTGSASLGTDILEHLLLDVTIVDDKPRGTVRLRDSTGFITIVTADMLDLPGQSGFPVWPYAVQWGQADNTVVVTVRDYSVAPTMSSPAYLTTGVGRDRFLIFELNRTRGNAGTPPLLARLVGDLTMPTTLALGAAKYGSTPKEDTEPQGTYPAIVPFTQYRVESPASFPSSLGLITPSASIWLTESLDVLYLFRWSIAVKSNNLDFAFADPSLVLASYILAEYLLGYSIRQHRILVECSITDQLLGDIVRHPTISSGDYIQIFCAEVRMLTWNDNDVSASRLISTWIRRGFLLTLQYHWRTADPDGIWQDWTAAPPIPNGGIDNQRWITSAGYAESAAVTQTISGQASSLPLGWMAITYDDNALMLVGATPHWVLLLRHVAVSFPVTQYETFVYLVNLDTQAASQVGHHVRIWTSPPGLFQTHRDTAMVTRMQAILLLGPSDALYTVQDPDMTDAAMESVVDGGLGGMTLRYRDCWPSAGEQGRLARISATMDLSIGTAFPAQAVKLPRLQDEPGTVIYVQNGQVNWRQIHLVNTQRVLGSLWRPS